MATTTTTTATVTVGGGTTVDNLNVLDTSKSNDLSGVEIITWTEVYSALFSTTKLSTQSQTLFDAFNAGSVKLTFQLGSFDYTIYRDGPLGNYKIESSSDLGLYSSLTGDLTSSGVYQTNTALLSTFLTNANSLFGTTALLTSADIDGGASKDNIQGIANNLNIHNIIQGGTGADIMSGGMDADYFVYKTAGDSAIGGQLNSGGSYAQTWDQITNFGQNAAGAGVDKLDFAALALAAGQSLSWQGPKLANTTDLGPTTGKYAVWYTTDGSGGSFVYAD